MNQPIPRSFYDRSPTLGAKELLGKILVRNIGDEVLTGKVVETEAYLGYGDAAAHGSLGKTKRTQILFGKPGLAYIFQLRGYCLLNVVTEEEGIPSGVLFRALEPVCGVEFIKHSLGPYAVKDTQLMNGPGKVCRALQINMAHYGTDFTALDSPFYLVEGLDYDFDVETSTRIGITKSVDMPYRYTIKGSRYTSR